MEIRYNEETPPPPKKTEESAIRLILLKRGCTVLCQQFAHTQKVKQSLDRPWGSHEVENLSFHDSRYMKVVRLSAPRTGGLYPPGNILLLISVRGWVDPRDYSAAGRIMSVTPSGIEPATSQIVAQCLYNGATARPLHINSIHKKCRSSLLRITLHGVNYIKILTNINPSHFNDTN